SLVSHWMAQMAGDGWRGAERVFDWSFYRQGTQELGDAASDTFVTTALEFFGDPVVARSAASPRDKAIRLAQLAAARRTLLVLDAVEPFQHPPGPLSGQLMDPALAALLYALASHNRGLCVVTTREPVRDLVPYLKTTVEEVHLQHLSTEAGVEL